MGKRPLPREWRMTLLRFILSLLVVIGMTWLLAGCQNGEEDVAERVDQPAVEATAVPQDTPISPAASPTTAPKESIPPVLPTKEPTPAAVAEEEAGTGNADVIFVSAKETAANVWTFNVTVAHPDTGWEDYADGWDVVLPDGTALKPDPESPFTRLLLHPHENEQPFTRSQSNIEIPADITEVTVRAHDLVDGFGGQEVVVDLTAASGPGFEVSRVQ